MNDLGNYSMQKMLSEDEYMHPTKKKMLKEWPLYQQTKK